MTRPCPLCKGPTAPLTVLVEAPMGLDIFDAPTRDIVPTTFYRCVTPGCGLLAIEPRDVSMLL